MDCFFMIKDSKLTRYLLSDILTIKVIFAVNEMDNSSSNTSNDVCISCWSNALEKGVNPSVLLQL